ncbi:MAG: ABC transporter permease [Stellaceae bacterium]
MTARRNRVTPVLIAVFAASGLLGGYLTEAANRLVSGRPIAIWQALDPPILIAIMAGSGLLVVLSSLRPSRDAHRAMLAVAAMLLLLLLDGAGMGAARLMHAAPVARRVSLGWAFWAMAVAAALAIIDAGQRLGLTPLRRLVVAAVILAAIAGLAIAGRFDQLSIVREFAIRRGAFVAQLIRHAELVAGAVVPAIVIGMPLGLWAARRPRVAPAMFGTLNILQTIPSIALFGLLIGPLTALSEGLPVLARLGVHGIGWAPAVVALILYALLPVARNTLAGIKAVDPAIVDAARGMGFGPARIFLAVEMPLGLPVFLAGLRIVLVETIGLAVIAALIGGGGLGAFIFQGIGEYAIALVLLGAIPVTLMALAADFVLQLWIATLDRRSPA